MELTKLRLLTSMIRRTNRADEIENKYAGNAARK